MIPFNRPSVAGREPEYVQEVLRSSHWCGDGTFTRRASELLSSVLPGARVLLTTSCTHALELAALLLELVPGDEVILPSFTFVSTANAIALRGVRPVFVDIRPDTLNLDEAAVERAVTPRTRAVFVVHYAGVSCEMDAIDDTARRRGLAIVEDNAHGLFGTYRGRPLGTLGAVSTLSFHETKNISCGEGGAIAINDRRLIERAEILREKGTNRTQFFRGQVDKYTWVDLGSSYLPSELLAAVLVAQLEERERIQARRLRIWNSYAAALRPWADRIGARLPAVPAGCSHPAHLFWIVFPQPADRDSFIAHMKQQGILTVFHYVPLHTSPVGERFGYRQGDLPQTEIVSDCLVRLPLFPSMTDLELDHIIDAAMGWEPAPAGVRSC